MRLNGAYLKSRSGRVSYDREDLVLRAQKAQTAGGRRQAAGGRRQHSVSSFNT